MLRHIEWCYSDQAKDNSKASDINYGRGDCKIFVGGGDRKILGAFYRPITRFWVPFMGWGDHKINVHTWHTLRSGDHTFDR